MPAMLIEPHVMAPMAENALFMSRTSQKFACVNEA